MKYFILVFLFSTFVFGQGRKKEELGKSEFPNYYSTINIGWMEIYSLSIGKYLNNDIAVAVKWSMFGVAGTGFGPSASGSVGLGINYYYKKILLFQYISVDYSILYAGGYKGYGVEAVIGNCTNRESGFGFVYEVGIGYSDVIAEYSYPQYQRKKMLGPIIKFGLNYNL